jgi:beta-galactosidase
VGGSVRLETKVETAGTPSALRLEVDRPAIFADGRDLNVVTVSALDKEGRPVPVADAPVDFAVAGGGRILGVGNGDPSSHEPDRIVATVKSLPFADFRDQAVPGQDTRTHRATLTSRGLPKDATLRLLLRHFGARSEVALNGTKIGTFEMTDGAPLPSVELPRQALREGENVLTVVATPYANDRIRERAQKVLPALLRVDIPAPPARRRLFNGLAQVIVQSTETPGPIRLTATAPGLSPAELTLGVAPPVSSE